MFEKINKKRLAGLMLAGVITAAGTSSAFAADQPSNQPPAVSHRQFIKIDKADVTLKVKAAIDNLVASGTITQAQADAVIKAYTPGKDGEGFKGVFKNPMSELVTAGTITQEQADAVNSAIKSGIEARKSMEDILAGLVSAGTITDVQKEALLDVFPSKGILQRGMVMHKASIDNLVTAGTITQAQADAFNEAMKSAKESKKSITDILKELVAAGTLTQTQADAINKEVKTRVESRIQAHKDGSAKDADNNKRPFSGGLDNLVDAGTITQAQADAINTAVKAALDSLREQ